jgi:tetratricopeptide (TPR) repeat protein
MVTIIVGTMTRWLTGSLRETPAAVPAMAALVLFVVWATSQAGYPLTHWAPGALIVLVLLAIALGAVPLRFAETPRSVKLALACLAAYTTLSYLSIAWAAAPADAWEGANRTLLYLLVFTLFALWRARGESATLLICAWTLAMIALSIYAAVHLDSAGGKGLDGLFSDVRLDYPVGYPNAAAAQWLMAFWPALLLARGERLPPALRGLFAGGAVILADLALFSQSRGSLYATPVMIVLVFALVPQRLRTFATAVPIALGVGATAPLVLRVGDRLAGGESPAAAVHSAIAAMFLAALVVGALVAIGATLERRPHSPALAAGVRRIVTATAIATLVLVLAAGLVAAGNPVTRVRHSWESFEGGYSTTATAGNRLLSGLGSNRYDFYRVALDEFTGHPLLGIGADNYQHQYLLHGRSTETPRYPHSVELRTLTQTGLLGGLLAVVGLGAALVAGWGAMHRTSLHRADLPRADLSRADLSRADLSRADLSRADPLARGAAAAALAGFSYWAVHGSFDWFWEFAGLGGPAFALLGIACSLAPGRGGGADRTADTRPPHVRREGVEGVSHIAPRARERGCRPGRILLASLAGLLALAAVVSLAAPWLGERDIQSAARVWPRAPLSAFSRLEEAADLNPLSDRAYLVAGSIALRFGGLARAEREFSLALRRTPEDAYAALELGAIASETGQQTRSVELLERASRLDPRDPLTLGALRTARSGGRVSVEDLNRSILDAAEQLA